MTTDRIAATIRRILEGAAKAGDPADYVHRDPQSRQVLGF
jgi:hypothetical protein